MIFQLLFLSVRGGFLYFLSRRLRFSANRPQPDRAQSAAHKPPMSPVFGTLEVGTSSLTVTVSGVLVSFGWLGSMPVGSSSSMISSGVTGGIGEVGVGSSGMSTGGVAGSSGLGSGFGSGLWWWPPPSGGQRLVISFWWIEYSTYRLQKRVHFEERCAKYIESAGPIKVMFVILCFLSLLLFPDERRLADAGQHECDRFRQDCKDLSARGKAVSFRLHGIDIRENVSGWSAEGLSIGIRERYSLSLLYLFQGRLYGGTVWSADAQRGSAGNVADSLSTNQPSGMLSVGEMF